MNWKDRYDVINTLDEDYILLGEHYSKKECNKMMKNYDSDFKIEENHHVWVRFCFVNYEDEVVNGFYVLNNKPKVMRGVIKATLIYSQESLKQSRKKAELIQSWF